MYSCTRMYVCICIYIYIFMPVKPMNLTTYMAYLMYLHTGMYKCAYVYIDRL